MDSIIYEGMLAAYEDQDIVQSDLSASRHEGLTEGSRKREE